MLINILGTEYEIKAVKAQDDPKLKDDCDGYCDTSTKTCVVDDMTGSEGDLNCKGNLIEYRKLVTRHEIVHAFLHESGLDVNSWGCNEEMVDWLAIQFPKMINAFKEAKCL